MKRTPFHSFHEQHGAKFVSFAGWEMPVSYGSVQAEHEAVRTRGGLFDVSHMARFRIGGRHSRRLLERLLTRRVSDMEPRTCRYSFVCNQAGGVLDDILVYRYEDDWMLVVNASNREKIADHLQRVAAEESFSVKFADQTESTAMVALQGPRVMEQIGRFSSEVPSLKYYRFTVKNLMILKLTISRTGYTGEDGVEIVMGANMAGMALKLLYKDDPNDPAAQVMSPAGLAARDTLRMEAGMPLYGHELDESIDPISAGLGFAVSLHKDEDDRGLPFIGQDALKAIAQDGPKRKLVGLALEGRRSPRQGMAVLDGDQAVGEVTSGCLSPTLGHPIAMAYVDAGCAELGRALLVDLGKTKLEARQVALPFYKRAKPA